jgi:hypothetical protein
VHGTWLEHAAFIKLLPRQIGKTSFIIKQALKFSGVVVVPFASNGIYAKYTNSKDISFKIYTQDQLYNLRGLDVQNEYLFVDDFEYLTQSNQGAVIEI